MNSFTRSWSSVSLWLTIGFISCLLQTKSNLMARASHTPLWSFRRCVLTTVNLFCEAIEICIADKWNRHLAVAILEGDLAILIRLYDVEWIVLLADVDVLDLASRVLNELRHLLQKWISPLWSVTRNERGLCKKFLLFLNFKWQFSLLSPLCIIFVFTHGAHDLTN